MSSIFLEETVEKKTNLKQHKISIIILLHDNSNLKLQNVINLSQT